MKPVATQDYDLIGGDVSSRYPIAGDLVVGTPVEFIADYHWFEAVIEVPPYERDGRVEVVVAHVEPAYLTKGTEGLELVMPLRRLRERLRGDHQ